MSISAKKNNSVITRSKRVAWTPFVRSIFSKDDIKRMKDEGVPIPIVWLNNHYYVFIWEGHIPVDAHDPKPLSPTHVAILARDNKFEYPWDDLQRIKNEIFGPESEAVEIYPAESRNLRTNQAHLYVMPAQQHWPIGISRIADYLEVEKTTEEKEEESEEVLESTSDTTS